MMGNPKSKKLPAINVNTSEFGHSLYISEKEDIHLIIFCYPSSQVFFPFNSSHSIL